MDFNLHCVRSSVNPPCCRKYWWCPTSPCSQHSTASTHFRSPAPLPARPPPSRSPGRHHKLWGGHQGGEGQGQQIASCWQAGKWQPVLLRATIGQVAHYYWGQARLHQAWQGEVCWSIIAPPIERLLQRTWSTRSWSCSRLWCGVDGIPCGSGHCWSWPWICNWFNVSRASIITTISFNFIQAF